MKRHVALLALVLLAGTAPGGEKQHKGYLMIIGGGDKPMDAMQEFVNLSHGKPILIITSASSDLEYGQFTAGQLKECGAVRVDLRHIVAPEVANSDSIVALIGAAGGVFFTGGDQDRLMNRIGHTRTEEALDRLYYERGGVIGGTSAGAAAMSEVMITGNELVNKDSTNIFHSIQAKNVETKRGFGFVKNAIIDQHFMMRKRHNRLIGVVLEHPELPGIGIDEEGAILVYPDGRFRVFGLDAVIVYDARKAKNIRVSDQGLLGGRNIKVDLLLPGDVYRIR
ncbi:MAG TPA: cyanophycinase [bacterium]|nr:cyanophycinase [bacterium]HQG46144.1 cyanophycinase [bacterium]HQI48600.1 cyanophycinase [bacterium]HQJ63091.1 cyanophycinase [bacterium]